MEINGERLAIIGLGYVGLPLAVEYGQLMPVEGGDVNQGPYRRATAWRGS